jgi:hypothetical protein
MKTLRLIINIILGICGFAIFNESDTFAPNVFGLFCLALLVAINVPADAWRQLRDRF